jgi:hypothetical protein
MDGEMTTSIDMGSLSSLREYWEDRGKTGYFEKHDHFLLEGISCIVDKISKWPV